MGRKLIKGVLLDLSGVVYVGNEVLPGAVAALERLRTLTVPFLCVTNTTRSTRLQGVLVSTGKYRSGDQDQLRTSGGQVVSGFTASVDLIDKNLSPAS